jgi:hypothetical protein
LRHHRAFADATRRGYIDAAKAADNHDFAALFAFARLPASWIRLNLPPR